MIARLRARHRRAWTALAVVLPLAWAAALAARPRWPLEGTTNGLGAPAVWPADARRVPAPGIELDVHVWADGLALVPRAPLALPDVLVYGTGDALEAGADVPADALLLGVLTGEGPDVLERPAGVRHLLFWSLARRAAVATADLGQVR